MNEIYPRQIERHRHQAWIEGWWYGVSLGICAGVIVGILVAKYLD